MSARCYSYAIWNQKGGIGAHKYKQIVGSDRLFYKRVTSEGFATPKLHSVICNRVALYSVNIFNNIKEKFVQAYKSNRDCFFTSNSEDMFFTFDDMHRVALCDKLIPFPLTNI